MDSIDAALQQASLRATVNRDALAEFLRAAPDFPVPAIQNFSESIDPAVSLELMRQSGASPGEMRSLSRPARQRMTKNS